MSSHDIDILIKVALLCATAAFWPQIMRGLRRLGLRKETETDSTSWRRGVIVAGVAVVLLLLGLIF